MKQTTINKLKEVKTLEDYLNVLQQDFETKSCKPGRLIRHTLFNTIVSTLQLKNPILLHTLKCKALECDSLDHFIETIKKNFNVKQSITDKAKTNLAKNTQALIVLTRLQEN